METHTNVTRKERVGAQSSGTLQPGLKFSFNDISEEQLIAKPWIWINKMDVDLVKLKVMGMDEEEKGKEARVVSSKTSKESLGKMKLPELWIPL